MDYSLYRYTCALLAVLLLSLSGTASAGWITELNKMNLAQPKQATKSLPVEASVRHRNTQTGASVYRRVHATIPVERIRSQAVSAAKRGRIHPGFLAATVAAGLLIDGDTGEIIEEGPSYEADIPDALSDYKIGFDNTYHSGTDICGWSSVSTTSSKSFSQYFYNDTWIHDNYLTDTLKDVTFVSCGNQDTGADVAGYMEWTAKTRLNESYKTNRTLAVFDSSAPELSDSGTGGEQGDPLSDSELEDQLDPEVLDRAEDIARSVMDDPGSDWSKDTDADNKIRSPRGAPENLRDKITRDRENTEAREKGEEEPHDETDGETTSSDDRVIDELTQDPDTLSTPEPPEPDWNVEEYGPDDLQPESIDVGGSAECPAPYSVELAEPFSGTFEIPFDYICDFAENVNPFFIAGAWLLAGFIVIRR